DLVDVADREGVVGAVVARGAGRTGAAPVPGLAHPVVLAHEQDVPGLRPPGHQHGHGLRLAEAGEVMEVAVLAVGILDVVVPLPHRGRRQNGDRVASHQAHELAAPARELLSRHRTSAPQCSGAADGAASSSNKSCTPTRTNSTSSAYALSLDSRSSPASTPARVISAKSRTISPASPGNPAASGMPPAPSP